MLEDPVEYIPTIARQRLYNLGIAQSEFLDATEVVRWLGAVQAQDYASAEWTIGLRFTGATPAHITAAIGEKKVIRTWLLRGTLHMVAASDLRWMRALLAPHLITHYTKNYLQVGLDDAMLTRCYKGIERVLEGGQQLTRAEFLAALEGEGIVLATPQLGQLLNRAALEGVICLGMKKGKQDTYTLFEEWVPQGPTLGREEALAELALRYFTSHAPTTLQDFAWWAGILVRDATIGLQAIQSRLTSEQYKGRHYWRPATPSSITQQFQSDSLAAYLLPGFDEFVLGYANRSDFLEDRHKQTISGINAVFAYTMVLDGQIVGTWKRTFRKSTVEITFSPFAPLSTAAYQAFATASRRYGDFFGLAVVNP